MDEISSIPLSISDVAVTSAGNLRAKYVFHAIVIDYDRGFYPNIDILENVITKCLNNLINYKIKSIAFPLIGTGVGDFPIVESFFITIKLIKQFLEQHNSIEEIWFVVYKPDKFAAQFRKVFIAAINNPNFCFFDAKSISLDYEKVHII